MFTSKAKGLEITGEARFHKGLAVPDGWVVNSPLIPNAGDLLPATRYDPKFPTNNATPPVSRKWTAP
jgi:hypothetical protein